METVEALIRIAALGVAGFVVGFVAGETIWRKK